MKAKIIIRIIYSFIFVSFISLLISGFASDDVVDGTRYYVSTLPALILLILYNIFNTIMYILYVMKHKNDDKISFFNKDKSKLKTMLSSSLLALFAMFSAIQIPAYSNIYDTEFFNNKLAFISENFTLQNEEYYTDFDVKISLNLEEQFSFLNYYSTKGNFKITNEKNNFQLSDGEFEFVEDIPRYCKGYIEDACVKNVRLYADDDTIKIIENNGIKIVYAYYVNDYNEKTCLDMCINNGKQTLLIRERFNSDVNEKVEHSINKWVKLLANISL